jgi:hypothetical protein
MRIRQVKPEFWSDPEMAELPPAVRLTYVGLWNIADDTGWFVADASWIAHELYGYDPREERELVVATHIVDLQAAGKVVVELCGHACIPTLPTHQRMTSSVRRVETVRRLHQLCIAADMQGPPRKSAVDRSGTVGYGTGTERNGTELLDGIEDATNDGSEFRRKVPRPAP